MLVYAPRWSLASKFWSYTPHVAYQSHQLIKPFPQYHLPKLKLISAGTLPWLITSLRLPWISQWEFAVALESDDPRCCILIFSRSAKDYLASRSRTAPSRLCYLLVSSALCSPWVVFRQSIFSVYAVVIPVRPHFAISSFAQVLAGTHSDSVVGTALRRAGGASCTRLS